MNTDRYTKILLTVIACALSGDLAERLVRPAHAAGPASGPPAATATITRVAICSIDNPNTCAGIYGSQKNSFDGTQMVLETRRGVGVFQQ